MRWGFAISAIAQTGQSDAIHSPEAWARMVVRVTNPAAWSTAVVCRVAISCWPSVLRTISSPVDTGAYRKLRSPSPGRPPRMVAVNDFSGLTSSACALAKAEASAATDSLDRCMNRLRRQDVEAHRPRLGTLASHPMANRLLGVLRHPRPDLALRPLVVEKCFAGVAEERCELGPRVRRAHIDNPDGFNARPRRLGHDEVRDLAGLNAAPELLFRRHQNGEIERVHRNSDLDPFAAAGDDGEH